MKNRGQLSLFAVLGIVIVVVIIAGLYFRGTISKSIEESMLEEREALTMEEKAVAKTVDDCIENTLMQAMFTVSGNGGYYPGVEDHMPYLSFKIPFYYDKGKENIPTLDVFSKSMANYIDSNLLNCLGQDVEVIEPPKTKVKITKTIQAEVNMLVKVKQSKLKIFSGQVQADFAPIYSEMKEFYNLVKKFNGSVDALELGRHVTEKDYKYSFETLNNASFFFMIWENYYKEKPLILTFGIIKEELETFDLEMIPEIFLPIEDLETAEEETVEEEPEEELQAVDYNSTKLWQAGDLVYEI